jgi:large subunit ribosomal protein L15
MSLALNKLKADNKDNSKKTRVGRGIGSGKGKTCGRGHKGQKSRSGVSIHGFEGGQMPIHRRLPKRGFNNYNRKDIEVVNLSTIQKLVDEKKISAKDTVNAELLAKLGVISNKKDGVKILAKGEIKSSVTFEVDKISSSAKQAVEKAGGKVTEITKASKETKKKEITKKN